MAEGRGHGLRVEFAAREESLVRGSKGGGMEGVGWGV